MNRIKRYVILAFLLVITGIIAPSSKAKAAEEVTNIEINYEEMELTFKSSDTEIYFASTNTSKTVWDTAEVIDGTAMIDLSWIKEKIDQTLYIKTESDAIYSIKIPKQETTLKAYWSPKEPIDVVTTTGGYIGCNEAGYLYFSVNGANKAVSYLTTISNIEWKKTNTSSWSSLDTLTLAQYQASGATLNFRLKAIDINSSNQLIGTVDTAKTITECTNATCSRTSNIVKLSYKKQANAPVVAINGDKLTLALKKGQEYKIGDSTNWINVEQQMKDDPAYAVSKLGAVSIFELYSEFGTTKTLATFDYSSDITVYVRTAATTKTTPSKTRTLEIKKPTVASTEATKPTVGYIDSKNSIAGYSIILASGAKTVQVVVIKAGTLDIIDLTKIKWSTLKAGAKVTFNTAALSKVLGTTLTKDNMSSLVVIYRLPSVKAVNKTGSTPVAFSIASKPTPLEASAASDDPTPTPTPSVGDKSITISYSEGIGSVTAATATEPLTIKFNPFNFEEDGYYHVKFDLTTVGLSKNQDASITVKDSAIQGISVSGGSVYSNGFFGDSIDLGISEHYLSHYSDEVTYVITAEGASVEFKVIYQIEPGFVTSLNSESTGIAGVSYKDYGDIAPMTLQLPTTFDNTPIYIDVKAYNLSSNKKVTLSADGQENPSIRVTLVTDTLMMDTTKESTSTSKVFKVELIGTPESGDKVIYTLTTEDGYTCKIRILIGAEKVITATTSETYAGIATNYVWQASRYKVQLLDDYVEGSSIFLDITTENFSADQEVTLALTSGYTAINGVTVTLNKTTVVKNGKTLQLIEIKGAVGYEHEVTKYTLTTKGATFEIEIIGDPLAPL